jgi:hypothetical protein
VKRCCLVSRYHIPEKAPTSSSSSSSSFTMKDRAGFYEISIKLLELSGS